MMESAACRTELFEETRILQRFPGAAPGAWDVISRSPSLTVAINEWLQKTGHVIVSCNAIGMHTHWLDQEMLTKALILAVIITYREKPLEPRDPDPSPVAVTGPAASNHPTSRPAAPAAAIRGQRDDIARPAATLPAPIPTIAPYRP